MRRRSGIPSSYTEAAGNSMARSHKTSDEHYSDASNAMSVRVPIGPAVPAPALQGTLIPRKNTQAADPTNPGSKANRQNIERVGATYRIQPKTGYAVVDPTVGPTMMNARIMPSIPGSVNNFFQESQTAAQ
jgi:hypothetical protein